MTVIPKTPKKPFSKFKLKDAYQQLNLKRLQPWTLEYTVIQPSEDFQKQYQRYQVFDLKRSEEGKKIIIDLVFVEVLQTFPALKFGKVKPWKVTLPTEPPIISSQKF